MQERRAVESVKTKGPPDNWYQNQMHEMEAVMCRMEGHGGRHATNIFKFARKLVKSQPCCKRELATVLFCDFFCFSKNSWSIGQNAPPNRRYLGTSLNGSNKEWRIIISKCKKIYPIGPRETLFF